MTDLAFVHEAVVAFDKRPSRAESLYDLARFYREKGMNEAALLFAEQGLRIPRPADILFVEDHVYEWGFKEEASICGFYSKDPAIRELGSRCCEDLALSRTVPVQTRQMAWRNLFFYTRSLGVVCPSFQAKRIDFEPPDGYSPMNPSVCRLGNRMFLNVRAVNYRIGSDGRYVMPEPVIKTRNFLFTLSEDLEASVVGEVGLPFDLPEPVWNDVLGFEDMRLFAWNNELWCSATARQLSADGMCEIVMSRIGPGGCRLMDWRVMRPDGERRYEKNWMPIINGPGFVYSCEPTRIVDRTGKTISESVPPVAANEWGGSSQLIPFDGGWLCLVHERIAKPGLGQRQYQRRFVWFNRQLEIKKCSRRFQFGDGEGEFVCGMCHHPDGKRLVISYGVLDREAWIATVSADEVRKTLGMPVTSSGPEPFGTGHRAAPNPSVRSILPWARGQVNRALMTKNSYEYAHGELVSAGLPVHRDQPKDWDNLIAIALAEDLASKNDLIMDAGGTRDSAFLPGLRAMGFKCLMNMNLDEVADERVEDDIRYLRGNITNTKRGDSLFGFVACLSVLEHGVDWRRFLCEMARILRPGGHLFVSFDYWEDKIDAGDRMAFNAPVKVFDKIEVLQMIGQAESMGLALVGDHDLRCGDRVVNWVGLDFTFMNLLFRRSSMTDDKWQTIKKP